MKLYCVDVDQDTGIPTIVHLPVLKRTRDGGYIVDDGYGKLRIDKDLTHDDYDEIFKTLEAAQKEARSIIKSEIRDLRRTARVFKKELAKYETNVVHSDKGPRQGHCHAESHLCCEGAGI